MAQEIVSSLLFKLADAVFKEAVLLYGVKDKVEYVERELRWIQSFLKDADSKRKGNNSVQNWVKDVREVSFMIEDAIDTFLIKVESLSLKEPGILNTLKRVCKKPKKLVAMHNLDSEINKIQARLKEITESKDRYGLKDLGDNNAGIVTLPNRPTVIPEIDEIDVVGFNTEKDKIIGMLLDENISRRSVVSIVGMGGLGKTTLAEKVYQSVKSKKQFEFDVWLTVSQHFKSIDLLKKILQKAYGEKFEKEREEVYYITEVNKFLTEKRYLIVLDDIWSDHVWTQIKGALPDNNKGSRVLITTRFLDIAKKADLESDPFELRLLSEEESLRLLFKKALPRNVFNEGYPHDLLEVANSFSKQCGHLPLALVVVGGMLSTKPRTETAWNKVMRTMDWQTDGKDCIKILASSYEDLPVHLKTCFIYLASFPDDTQYEPKLIIRLWVAEGFIPHDARGTVEEKAEKYLEELAQRCMIQVTDRSRPDSVIWSFRVHDLLLDLAIREAQEKDFLNVFRKQNNSQGSNVTRRVTFQLADYNSDDTSKLAGEYSIPNVRTLFFFGKVVPFDSQFKLLRVLVIIGIYSGEHPYWLINLKSMLHLRCLVFRDCEFETSKLTLDIDHLHNLQTLKIFDCSGIVIKGSESTLANKNLKHVDCAWSCIVIRVGSASPDPPSDEMIFAVYGWREPEIILTIKNDSWEAAFARLDELKQRYPSINLDYLQLNSRVIPLLEITDNLDRRPTRILYLNGEIQSKNASLNDDMFRRYVKNIVLSQSHIDQMQVLPQSQFRRLVLYKGAYIGKRMICSANSFSTLLYLEISLLEKLEEWHIEDGALPELFALVIQKCLKLRVLPNLQYLKKLYYLMLKSMPEKFIRRVQNEDKHKIEHIEEIKIEN
ncbi:hypothetical protein LUZ60_002513 [Juncus effusus]|nr:hypothetical protein LUZ60_002513 [Juncus effusus]